MLSVNYMHFQGHSEMLANRGEAGEAIIYSRSLFMKSMLAMALNVASANIQSDDGFEHSLRHPRHVTSAVCVLTDAVYTYTLHILVQSVHEFKITVV